MTQKIQEIKQNKKIKYILELSSCEIYNLKIPNIIESK